MQQPQPPGENDRLVGVLSLGDIVERAGDEDAAEQALEGISHPTEAL